MSIIWIYVMSRVRPVGRPSSCMAKTLTLDIMRTLFIQFRFMPAMLIGTIDVYHFIPLSLTLTLPGGQKVNAKQNCWLHFLPRFFSD